MSKEFKSQDYFRYKRLGKRWRRPVGWQSKLRLKKGGSGRKVSIGYGTRKEGALDEVMLVSNVNDVVLANGKPIRIASSVGSRKTIGIVQKAQELGSRIVNSKKARRALKISKGIEARKTKAKEKKKEEVKENMDENKEAGAKGEKKAESEKLAKAETKAETKTEAEVRTRAEANSK